MLGTSRDEPARRGVRDGRQLPAEFLAQESSLIDEGAITTIGVVTRDRLSSLVACLESCLENCRLHARSPECVVTDDPLGAEAADRTKEALREVAKRLNARIRYAGRGEKARFADVPAAESAVSPTIIRFAIFGDERCRLSTGANRNSLLLDTAGTLLLSVDDDTLCRIAVAPEHEIALAFFSGYDPTEFRFSRILPRRFNRFRLSRPMSSVAMRNCSGGLSIQMVPASRAAVS